MASRSAASRTRRRGKAMRSPRTGSLRGGFSFSDIPLGGTQVGTRAPTCLFARSSAGSRSAALPSVLPPVARNGNCSRRAEGYQPASRSPSTGAVRWRCILGRSPRYPCDRPRTTWTSWRITSMLRSNLRIPIPVGRSPARTPPVPPVRPGVGSYVSHPTPSPSPSKWWGSGGRTWKLR